MISSDDLVKNHWTTLLKEESKPKCYGNYPFCPEKQRNTPCLNPLEKLEVPSCEIWRLCRTEYLSKFFNNPSFRHGKIEASDESK